MSQHAATLALRLLCRANRHIRLGADACCPVLRPSVLDSVDLGVLVDRLCEFGKCSDSVMAGAFCLMRRLDMSEARLPVTDRTAHRLLIACALLSRKLVEDSPLSNHHLAKVACVPESDLVALEEWLLRAINFEAFISPAALATTERQLARIREVASRINVDELHAKGVPLTFATLAAAPEVVFGDPEPARSRSVSVLPFRLATRRNPLSLFRRSLARAASAQPSLPVVLLPANPR